MSHRQEVVIVGFLDGDSEGLEAEDGHPIVAGQELQELLLVLVAEVVKDGPKVDDGRVVFGVALLDGRIQGKISQLSLLA